MDEIRALFESKHIPKPTLILLRGPPGTGKSTLAKEFQAMVHGIVEVKVFTTDDLLEKNGCYVYDHGKRTEAHKLNQLRAKDAMDQECRVIIVPNTNIQLWEMREYVRYAIFKGYNVLFGVCEGTHTNIHKVPEGQIMRMTKQFQHVTSLNSVVHAFAPFESCQRYISKEVDRAGIKAAARFLPGLVDAIGMKRVIEGIGKRDRARKGGYHVTYIPPGVKLDLMDEIEAQRMMDTLEFSITGMGHTESGVFFLTCELPSKVLEWRSKKVPGAYFPHITLGFLDKDVHDVPKVANVPVREATQIELAMCELILDPEVVSTYRGGEFGEGVMFKAREVPGVGDDVTYTNNPDLCRTLRRGHMVVNTGRGWEVGVLGLPKFSGMRGSEDVDTDSDSGTDCLRIRSEADSFAVSLKENGAAGSLRFLHSLERDTYLALVGTKLVISFYEYNRINNSFKPLTEVTPNQNRNARAFEVLLRGCGPTTTVIEELVKERLTVCVEILDRNDKHIVEYTEDEDICAVVLALSCVNGSSRDLSWADHRGLRTVQRAPPRPISELGNLQIPQDIEGFVLTYFHNGLEIGKEKIKSHTYVIKRSIRQVGRGYLSVVSKLLNGKREAARKREAGIGKIVSDAKRSEAAATLAMQHEEIRKIPRTEAGRFSGSQEKAWINTNKFDFLNDPSLTSMAIRTMKNFLVWYGEHYDDLPKTGGEFIQTFPDVWQTFCHHTGFSGFTVKSA